MGEFSCDLLEKSYFCSIANNWVTSPTCTLLVVICLKNRTFAVSQTTQWIPIQFARLLWFAWKIVLLQYRKQQTSQDKLVMTVVICLKNRTFAVSQTTITLNSRKIRVLWFAWKIVLLQYRKQQWLSYHRRRHGCDLLEKSYFCSIANNLWTRDLCQCGVVICLKNRTFAVSQTTFEISLRRRFSCDLLEKSYFCSIANNSKSIPSVLLAVVICLKNRTFAVSQTT